MEENQNQNSAVLNALLSLSSQVASIDKNLAINTTETAGMREQLTKLNGKVANHESSLGTLEQSVALILQAKKIDSSYADDWKAALLDKIVWLGLALLGIVIYTLLIRTHTIAPLSTLVSPQPVTQTK